MHAVFGRPSTGTAVGARAGFSVSGIGAAAAPGPSFFAPFDVLPLILFLRLVEAGSQDNLAWALLDVEPREVQVTRPRRPPQHRRDLREVLGPHREYRPAVPVSLRCSRAHPPARLLRASGDYLFRRRNLPRYHPLHRPQG